MSEALRGTLSSSSLTPALGEITEELARLGRGDVVIEHILSGALPSPVDYQQSQDEWVLVLEGAAVLEVGDERFDLTRGDWVLLPASVPHRLVDSRPGTSWLTVHSFP
jgi:cupin 2 domain-containing protein